MTRRLLNFLTFLSLLLCVAAVVLWVRSYRHAVDRVLLCTGSQQRPDRRLFTPGIKATSASGLLSVRKDVFVEIDTAVAADGRRTGVDTVGADQRGTVG